MSNEIHQLGMVIGQIQAQAITYHHVLRRLLAHIAETQAGPDKFLADLYEDLSRTLEQRDHVPGELEKPVNQEIKITLQSLFVNAGRDMRSKRRSKND